MVLDNVENIYLGDVEWLLDRVKTLPVERETIQVSAWAAEKRHLPPELTENPGPWDNSFMPYLVEIMDALSPDSPAQDVGVMKCRQMGVTTGPIENWIGVIIDKGLGPTMYLSGSSSLSKSSIEIKVDRMIASADLEHKIRSTVKAGRQLSGNTTTRKDFMDGFLLSYGGKSTATIRGISIKNLILDELDEFAGSDSKQGSIVELALSQQMGFDRTRKTFYNSTPILTDGPIHKVFKNGDQRKYFVPCKFCGFTQILECRGRREDGNRYGIHYELDKDSRLIVSSVEYRCQNCLKGWKDTDKYDFLNAGEWRPTAIPIHPLFWTFHLDGLYSPKFSWESMVHSWLRCWDPVKKRIFDIEALRVFQNTKRGLPYEERGEAPLFEVVIQHRRDYEVDKIPNKMALQETGSPVLLLTAGADVHKKDIRVEVKGWCLDSRSYSVNYYIFEGDTDNLNSSAWTQFRELIENKIWEGDDGKKYKIMLTLIDASYKTDTVYQFCADYQQSVFPIMGRDMPPQGSLFGRFKSYTKQGITAFNIVVTLYKDRLASWFRRDWNTSELQPMGYPNFPRDYRDDFFREYTYEKKREKKRRHGGGRIGYVWRPDNQNQPVHAWDCGIYNVAALDMICHDTNLVYLGQDRLDYSAFWKYIAEQKLFYVE